MKINMYVFLAGLALSCVSLGKSSLGPNSGVLEKVRLHYTGLQDASPTALQWKPSGEELAVCKGTLRRSNSKEIDRAASAFTLAFRNLDRERNVRILVTSAKKAPAGNSPETDAVSTLPTALQIIYFKTKSPAALSAIATLNLDGAPAEVMQTVRGKVFHRFPTDLARVWEGLTRSQKRALEEDVAATDVGADLRKYSKGAKGRLRAFSKAVLSVPDAG